MKPVELPARLEERVVRRVLRPRQPAEQEQSPRLAAPARPQREPALAQAAQAGTEAALAEAAIEVLRERPNAVAREQGRGDRMELVGVRAAHAEELLGRGVPVAVLAGQERARCTAAGQQALDRDRARRDDVGVEREVIVARDALGDRELDELLPVPAPRAVLPELGHERVFGKHLELAGQEFRAERPLDGSDVAFAGHEIEPSQNGTEPLERSQEDASAGSIAQREREDGVQGAHGGVRSVAYSRPLRVLARPAFKNRRLNPYNAILYRGLADLGVRVDEYTPLRALGRYDVFHVHWPESTFNHTLVEALATTSTLLAAMDVLARRGARTVWTVHNLEAHERRFPGHERAFFQRFVRRLDGVIALSAAGLEAVRERYPELRSRPGFVIPHHHYRGQYPDTITRSEARRRLDLPETARVILFCGRIEPYKNVPALATAFGALDLSEARLVIAGKPRTEALRRELEAFAARDPRILFRPGRVADDALQVYLRAADLVALPYRDILNSGSAILALSFDRPVIVPALGACAELADTVGREWVHATTTFGPSELAAALDEARALPERTSGAHLEALSPERVARATEESYRALLGAPP